MKKHTGMLIPRASKATKSMLSKPLHILTKALSISRRPAQQIRGQGKTLKAAVGALVVAAAWFGGSPTNRSVPEHEAGGGTPELHELAPSLVHEDEQIREEAHESFTAFLSPYEYPNPQKVPVEVTATLLRDIFPVMSQACISDDLKIRGSAIGVIHTITRYHDEEPERVKEMVPRLVKLMSHDDHRVVTTAMSALGHLAPEATSAIPVISRFLEEPRVFVDADPVPEEERGPGYLEPSDAVRDTAVRTLGSILSSISLDDIWSGAVEAELKQILAALSAASQDPCPDVREGVPYSLQTLVYVDHRSEETVEIVLRLLSDESSEVRRLTALDLHSATRTLVMAVAPKLREIAKSDDWAVVREAAFETLEKLQERHPDIVQIVVPVELQTDRAKPDHKFPSNEDRPTVPQADKETDDAIRELLEKIESAQN